MEGTVVAENGVDRKAGVMGFTKSFCKASFAWTRDRENTVGEGESFFYHFRALTFFCRRYFEEQW